LITANVFSQPVIINDFLNNSKTKIVVIDSTIKETNKAAKNIAFILSGINYKIVSLKQYVENLALYKKSPAIFWGVFVPSGLIWNSLSDIHTLKKTNYLNNKISINNSLTERCICFGINPYNNKDVLLLFSYNENNLHFNEIPSKWALSYYNYQGTLLYSAGAIDKTSNTGVDYNIDYIDGNISKDEVLYDGNITIYNYTQFQTTIISLPDTIDFIYNPACIKTIIQTGQESGLRYLVDAPYFNGMNESEKYTGRLTIYGNALFPEIDFIDDQRTHIVQYNKREQKIRFVKRDEFVSDKDSLNSLEFQAGPVVINNNLVDTNCIKSSLHKTKNASRTLLASTNNKNVFFITIRDGVDLAEIGKFLLSLDIFKGGKLDVINLNDGSASALYSRKFSTIRFNSFYKIPFLLAVR
jgi:hypothetical protein